MVKYFPVKYTRATLMDENSHHSRMGCCNDHIKNGIPRYFKKAAEMESAALIGSGENAFLYSNSHIALNLSTLKVIEAGV